LNVVEHKDFLNGTVDTRFIDENPELFDFTPSQNRAQKLLNYLGQVIVNGPQTPIVTGLAPSDIEVYPPPFPTGKLFGVYTSIYSRYLQCNQSITVLDICNILKKIIPFSFLCNRFHTTLVSGMILKIPTMNLEIYIVIDILAVSLSSQNYLSLVIRYY